MSTSWTWILLPVILAAAYYLSAGNVSGSAPKTQLLSPCLDYGRSFINTRGPNNAPRFWIESRCLITDPATGETVQYFQTGSCKSEHTFGEKDLFSTPNYDFMPIFSDSERLVFRRRAEGTGGYRAIDKGETSGWGGIVPFLRTFKGRVLSTPDEIHEAMKAGKPIVGQTEIRDEKTGRTAIIEYPIKTLNWRGPTDTVGYGTGKAWQVDTGPILFPDLGVPAEQYTQKIVLAYIAFSKPDWADFVLEELTPVGDKQVYHYSRTVHKVTRNVLLAQDED